MNLKIEAKLDRGFKPMALVCREMREATKDDGQDIVVAVERNQGYTYVTEQEYIKITQATTRRTANS